MNIDIRICNYQCVSFARMFEERVEITFIDTFTNNLYYPPEDDEPENIARYFFFMVAIDHRTSRENKPYEAWINGRLYHGADLLYYLGARKYHEDPQFFNPERMSKITLDELRNWLCVNNASLWDEEIRLMLLRDAAQKLIKLFNGNVLEVIRRCKRRLKHKEGGFIDLLKTFRAYEDPVEKKAYLLAKFLSRRKILHYQDVNNVRLPIDNHLTRIAFRTGIVTLGRDLLQKVLREEEASYIEDIVVRFLVREAYYEVTKHLKIDPFLLDDFLWLFGRKVCRRSTPLCDDETIRVSGFSWTTHGCPFKEICKAYNGDIPININEHKHLLTWYY